MPQQWVPYVKWSFLGYAVDSHDASFVVAFVTIVTATLMVGRLAGAGVGKMVVVGGVGRMDRLAGLMFGVLRGSVIVTLLVVMAGLTRLPAAETWRASVLLPTFEAFAHFAVSQLPERYGRHFLFGSVPPGP